MKEIIITGGTGLVGTRLAEILVDKGFGVTILTRNTDKKPITKNIKYAYWDTSKKEIDKNIFTNNAIAIVNLAGEGIAEKRWTEKQKNLIVSSRVDSSKTIFTALKANKNNIEVVVNASAIGWYKSQTIEDYNSSNYQENQEANTDFLGTTCKLWEESIEPVLHLNKRLVKLRFGIVLSKKGGALKEFLKPVKFGIAAILGNQKISWIHIDDLCNLIIESINNNKYEGAYNAVAPNLTTNKELNTKLAQKKNGNWFVKINVPNFIIKLMLGEMSIELLKNSLVSCKKISDNGFTFSYPTIDSALEEICN